MTAAVIVGAAVLAAACWALLGGLTRAVRRVREWVMRRQIQRIRRFM